MIYTVTIRPVQSRNPNDRVEMRVTARDKEEANSKALELASEQSGRKLKEYGVVSVH